MKWMACIDPVISGSEERVSPSERSSAKEFSGRLPKEQAIRLKIAKVSQSEGGEGESGSSRLAYVFVQILAISVHAVDGQQHATITQPEKGFTNTDSVHREVAIILLAANVIH